MWEETLGKECSKWSNSKFSRPCILSLFLAGDKEGQDRPCSSQTQRADVFSWQKDNQEKIIEAIIQVRDLMTFNKSLKYGECLFFRFFSTVIVLAFHYYSEISKAHYLWSQGAYSGSWFGGSWSKVEQNPLVQLPCEVGGWQMAEHGRRTITWQASRKSQ